MSEQGAQDVRRLAAKQVAPERAAELIAAWRRQGATVVLAAGGFDLIDAATARTLAEARPRGGRLVVAVQGDRSVAALGPGRPVLGASQRATVAAALRAVDLVIVLDDAGAEPTLESLGADLEIPGPESQLAQRLREHARRR
jgi:bifunctional ADP-heptose synthase (sugar kinase/adenylyltransferase)